MFNQNSEERVSAQRLKPHGDGQIDGDSDIYIDGDVDVDVDGDVDGDLNNGCFFSAALASCD